MPAVASSNVETVDYDDARGVMTVRFKSGGVYEYLDVPRELYDNVLRAPSVGGAVHTVVKDSYQYRRIG